MEQSGRMVPYGPARLLTESYVQQRSCNVPSGPAEGTAATWSSDNVQPSFCTGWTAAWWCACNLRSGVANPFRGCQPRTTPADARGAAAAGLPLLLAGVTAPAGITEAPAFSSCAVNEAISSSQLLAKD